LTIQFFLIGYVNDILMQNEIDHLWTTFNTLRCLQGNLTGPQVERCNIYHVKFNTMKGKYKSLSKKIQEKMSDKLNLREDEGNDKGLCVINP
jgi:hypothetical protein